jgi:hypothetical protein
MTDYANKYGTIERINGSPYWASYFINGDSSGLDEEEKTLADAWLKFNAVIEVLGVADEAHFTWHYPTHVPGAKVQGGEVIEYQVICDEA